MAKIQEDVLENWIKSSINENSSEIEHLAGMLVEYVFMGNPEDDAGKMQCELVNSIYRDFIDDKETLKKLSKFGRNKLYFYINKNKLKNEMTSYNKEISIMLDNVYIKINIIHNMYVYLESLLYMLESIEDKMILENQKVFYKYKSLFEIIEQKWLKSYQFYLENLLRKLNNLNEEKTNLKNSSLKKIQELSKIIKGIENFNDKCFELMYLEFNDF